MTYKEVKTLLGWEEKDVAKFFGYKTYASYMRSSGRERNRQILTDLVSMGYHKGRAELKELRDKIQSEAKKLESL